MESTGELAGIVQDAFFGSLGEAGPAGRQEAAVAEHAPDVAAEAAVLTGEHAGDETEGFFLVGGDGVFVPGFWVSCLFFLLLRRGGRLEDLQMRAHIALGATSAQKVRVAQSQFLNPVDFRLIEGTAGWIHALAHPVTGNCLIFDCGRNRGLCRWRLHRRSNRSLSYFGPVRRGGGSKAR